MHIELDAVIYEVMGSVDSSSHHNNRKQAPRPLGAWCWGWGIRIEFPGTSYKYPSEGERDLAHSMIEKCTAKTGRRTCVVAPSSNGEISIEMR